MTPVGCVVGPSITGQLTLEGIPVLGLVNTGASLACMGFSVWWQYRAQWGPLKPFGGVVHVAHGKPLQIAGKTQHLDLQCGEARGRACFIVIIGLESPPCLIGMDIMRPLRSRIDVTISMPPNSRILLPPPLAVLCCCKPRIFPLRLLDSFDATTLGLLRTSIIVPRMLCQRL